MHATQALIGQYPCFDQAIQTREFKSTVVPLNIFNKTIT